jgi:hypothetical protein
MSKNKRIIFMAAMSIALMFGFSHLFFPDFKTYNFERLHIFLFNLCTGGSAIIYFTEVEKLFSKKMYAFFILSLAYAMCAFFKIYLPAIFLSVLLAIIVESERVKRFSFFPKEFFSSKEPVYDKFHQASLLCLSIGLLMSGLVIANNEFYTLITMPRLKLDVFFLGFSFPVSLITMSIMFNLMEENVGRILALMKEAGFWIVNLGVIIFFLFIIFEKLVFQVYVTAILAGGVGMIFFLFKKLGRQLQQKNFLLSGMVFLLLTAVTGILYIIFEFLPSYNNENFKWLLRLHAFVSLYGWNLSGLAVIMRYGNFPIRLNSSMVIALHWTTVLVLAPLGYFYRFFSVPAVICYIVLLYIMLFSGGTEKAVG